MALLAGATAGIVAPVNPLLAPEHIAGILRDTGAKVVVTLAPFPKTDLAAEGRRGGGAGARRSRRCSRSTSRATSRRRSPGSCR